MNEQIIKAQRMRIVYLQKIEAENEKAIANIKSQNEKLIAYLDGILSIPSMDEVSELLSSQGMENPIEDARELLNEIRKRG